MKQILDDTDAARQRVVDQNITSLRYYLNENDITLRNNGISKINKKGKNEALRSADNRISNNFHELIVDQEASYLTSNRPQIDVDDNDNINKQVDEVLGDDLTLTLNKLVVDASNAGAGWVHYWVDSKNKKFNYAIVPPEQVTPIYDESLVNGMIAVRRTYRQRDDDGTLYDIHEYWDDKTCTFFKCKSSNATYQSLTIYNKINYVDNTTQTTTDNSNVYEHNLGRIPFIKFAKNLHEHPEISKYKGLIDAYDSIYNGYLNDLDDIQEVVFVLKNFGGQDLASFKKDLKETKALKFEDDGGVDTLSIEIPREARDDMLDITRSSIFLMAKSVDPSKVVLSNATATAIKQLQSQLEEKANLTQQYFQKGLNELIRAILKFLNIPNYDDAKISQTWTRATVQNTLEQAQALNQVAQFSSDETIAKANPFVSDWKEELAARKKQLVDDGYSNDNALDLGNNNE